MPEPYLFVIFGATGDLTHRKLIPALVKLMTNQDETCLIVGASGSDWSDEQFRETARASL